MAGVEYGSNHTDIHFLCADSVGDCGDVGGGAVEAFGAVKFNGVGAKFDSGVAVLQSGDTKNEGVMTELDDKEGGVLAMVFYANSWVGEVGGVARGYWSPVDDFYFTDLFEGA